MDPKYEDEQWAIKHTLNERSNTISNEEMAAKLKEGSKAGEDISSDMDEAARVAEEALKRLSGEA